MTSKKQLKVRVRAQMARTGETYTTARRHVAGTRQPLIDHGYALRGGVHPESANLSNVLAFYGVDIEEALIFGIGGGPGAGYILWEFDDHQTKVLTLAFRN